MANQVWLSPLHSCDLCGKPFGDGPNESMVMADASVRGGSWGNVCDECIANPDNAIRIGQGTGQKYELTEISREADGTPIKFWVKADG